MKFWKVGYLFGDSDFGIRVLLSVLLCVLLRAPAVVRAGDLRRYDSKYYIIYTDLDEESEKEAALRMTRMAEEYHDRTKGFAGQINSKFPFYLYKESADYFAAGGMKGTAGLFKPDPGFTRTGKLMAIAGQRLNLQTWQVVQHEGFHQFVHAVIGGGKHPPMNEGMAEYFGEGIFTGDGFVTGIVPPWRLQRLKEEIEDKKVQSIKSMMLLSQGDWNQQMNIRNYDQAWSMVHFLVTAEDAKYQPLFVGCIRDISRGKSFEQAWLANLGNADGFEKKWSEYWLGQPASPTSLLYSRANVATLTSYLARATAMHQKFGGINDFAEQAQADKLDINPQDWLPHSLLADNLRVAHLDTENDFQHWSLVPASNKQPTLVLKLADGTVLTGSFTLSRAHVEQVNVDVDDMASSIKQANDLLDGGEKTKARALLANAIHEHPQSGKIADAKKLLASIHL